MVILRRGRKLIQLVPGLQLLGLCVLSGCEQSSQPSEHAASAHPSVSARGVAGAPPTASPAASTPPGPATSTAPTTDVEPPGPNCPPGMIEIAGGRFWAGKRNAGGNPEEHPAFETEMHGLCMDETEVTTAAYEACVQAGRCTTAQRERVTCTQGREGREDHPINCVTWSQAEGYCRSVGARLPTEVEWEYAARGGAQYRKYSWGEEDPDGRTCWKGNRTCPIKSYPPGAFGLFDMNGNVWEWTDSYFAPYPWPATAAPHKVYRGGSWSRRFEKWLSLTLRNRYSPGSYGSHLGFRCATLPERATCPYGEDSSERGRFCRRGVESVDCPRGRPFNGQRCAPPGAPLCPKNTQPKAGFGCVPAEASPSAPPKGHSAEPRTLPVAEVTSAREPRFDADCTRYSKRRPVAYRFSAGSHAARNEVGRQRGCKNRDVGVGWNSACCPR